MRGICLLAIVLLTAGCATLPRHVQKPRSEALTNPESTTLGRLVAAEEGNRNLSGVHLVASGEEALADLIGLADHAERTLDVQYYIFQQDDSARILLHHLRLAADRGVRVRLLIDDLNTAGEDRRFLTLGERANIEVRLFNPFPSARFATWTRFLASASDIRRINHRMHNKLFVADNSMAITGGRNIGDQYFTRDSHSNFIDLDVVAAGPIVPQLSRSFDAFWNSKYAYPIASLASGKSGAEAAGGADEKGADASGAPLTDPEFSPAEAWLVRGLEARNVPLTWAPATVLVDKPAKMASDTEPDQEVTIANSLSALMRTAAQELIVISPYFIPGKEGVELMRELVEKGVHVRILTNSLASTDSPLVDTGYARYRVPLLEAGVELSEVRPKLGQKRVRFHPFRSSHASLHAKAIVIDQRTVFIGSMNMDGRSARFNSELGLVMRSAEIAHQVTGLLDDLSADGSYRLKLTDHHRVEWISGEAGSQRDWLTDPETTRLQRFTLKLLAPFAPEELL
ncbi:MAG TPA: phospholipase D family protein [Steroidobacteraceae bacterium]|jgi:phosphatidylserine/phosphatidylglycerophosphate/cardiolipin synthase-like enzyme|nr:phospholipase D family protein [Steroidobacteraceae bacterium]